MEDRGFCIGRYFGNYQIISEIACGSFGCVYRARHNRLPRIAAIKLLHSARLRSRHARDTFFQEAQLLERLKHPHILSIYEFSVDDGLPYLVTEYATGGSLRDLLKRWSPQPLPLDGAIYILSQIGDALHFAHQQNVIHHDLKPENILFNSKGDILLADFGIAIIQTTATLEQTVTFNGTPAYMAPEQFQGGASRRSDQYALGCIAYEVVTGRKPFKAPTAIAMGFKHMREYPIPPTRLNSDLPPDIETAILKALEKRRINRYPDVFSFIQELQRSPIAQMHESTIDRLNSLSFLQKTEEQYLNKGIALYNLGRYTEATAAYEQALLLDPYFTDAYFGKGNTLYSLGRYKEALVAFEQAINLDPSSAVIYHNQGSAFFMLGRYTEALAAYEQALLLDPHLVNAHEGKNLTLRQLRRL